MYRYSICITKQKSFLTAEGTVSYTERWRFQYRYVRTPALFIQINGQGDFYSNFNQQF